VHFERRQERGRKEEENENEVKHPEASFDILADLPTYSDSLFYYEAIASGFVLITSVGLDSPLFYTFFLKVRYIEKCG
jgi:hypothetical protein